VHYWFNKELKAFAKEVLLNRNAKIRNLIERKALQNLIDFKGEVSDLIMVIDYGSCYPWNYGCKHTTFLTDCNYLALGDYVVLTDKGWIRGY